jgi:hypothetical protein
VEGGAGAANAGELATLPAGQAAMLDQVLT